MHDLRRILYIASTTQFGQVSFLISHYNYDDAKKQLIFHGGLKTYAGMNGHSLIFTDHDQYLRTKKLLSDMHCREGLTHSQSMWNSETQDLPPARIEQNPMFTFKMNNDATYRIKYDTSDQRYKFCPGINAKQKIDIDGVFGWARPEYEGMRRFRLPSLQGVNFVIKGYEPTQFLSFVGDLVNQTNKTPLVELTPEQLDKLAELIAEEQADEEQKMAENRPVRISLSLR